MKIKIRYLAVIALFMSTVVLLRSQVEIYPVMPGVDLNPDFEVRIDDGTGFRPVPVQDIVDVCFVQFSITGEARIEITVSQSIDSWKIAPERSGVQAVVEDRVMTFDMGGPGKLIVLINEGAGNHTVGLDGLCILADPPETGVPLLSDPDVVNIKDYGVDTAGNILGTAKIQQALDENSGSDRIIYFPSGIYKSGMLHMRSRQSIYLAPGAVLLGSADHDDYVRIPGEGSDNEHYMIGSWRSDHIRIFGRGIINGNGTALRLQDPAGADFKTHNIQFQGSNDVSIEGIVSLNAASWSIEPIYCDSVLIRNVKVLSDLRYYDSKNNTDGIDPNKCRHVIVDDCLIWSGDDAVSPKQDHTYDAIFPPRNIHDHTYSNIITFTRKSAVKIGSETLEAGKEFYDMTFSDFDVVYADRAICIWSEGGALVNYITFKDFRIDEISTEYKQSHIHCRIDQQGNSIKNVNFINISAKEPAPRGSTFNGDNLNNTVDGRKVQYHNIQFHDYTIGGQPVLSLEDPNAGFNLMDDQANADSTAFSFDATSNSTWGHSGFRKEVRIYPNPCRDCCHIDFNLEKPDNVLITVRNLEGRLINTLMDNPLQHGAHSVQWHYNAGIPGVYLIHLQAGTSQARKKVVKL